MAIRCCLALGHTVECLVLRSCQSVSGYGLKIFNLRFISQALNHAERRLRLLRNLLVQSN